MEDLLPLILTALIGLVVGLVAGILIAGVFISRKGDSSSAPRAGLEHVAQLWRETGGNKLVVQVGDEVFDQASGMQVAGHVKLLRVARAFYAWLELPFAGLGFSGPPEGVPARAAPGASTLETIEVEPAELPLSVAQAASSSGLPVLTARPIQQTQAALDGEVKPVSMNPISALTRAVRSKPKTETPPASLVAQVDEILRSKLENSPLKDRNIRLMELPGMGMVVMVGAEQYDGIGAIPYPEIRDLLQECVAEWEKQVARNNR